MSKNRQNAVFGRRQFLKRAGQVVAGGAFALGSRPGSVLIPGAEQPAGVRALPAQPNLLFIVTDQERVPQHWSWDAAALAANLPARQKLLTNGLSFTRAFCNSAMCSPSRATLMTGYYPPQHGLIRTLTYNETALSNTEVPLPTYIPNMANMLASAGYHVAIKGKWHLSKNSLGNAPDENDVKAFGYLDWEPTTAGEATATGAFGGGCAQNDAKIVDDAVAWLGQASLPEPFALFVMLANPHDVLAFPKYTNNLDESCSPDTSYAGPSTDWTWGIELPPTFGEDLVAANKPSVQNASLGLYAAALGTLPTVVDQRKYVNFYAYLHTLVDQQINRVLSAVEGWSNARRPVIIRTADHGEMGLSHGGLRQKMFNVYEETIHVPLIISHPDLPNKGTTNSLASLVDILPTVASLANVPNKAAWTHSGVDLTPIINDPTAALQDTILFTFDDDRAGTGSDPGFLTSTPIAHHIRCIRCDYNGKQWKYARYFNPADEEAAAEEFELYCLTDDPLEQDNLYSPTTPSAEQTHLQDRLAQVEAERLKPLGITYLPVFQK
jgi:arylsulfatase A-like enzyme